MTPDSAPSQQDLEHDLAYVGSWTEQSDPTQQSGSSDMNSDSSGSTNDGRDGSATNPEETNQNGLNDEKGNEGGEEHTPLGRYVAQEMSEEAWVPRKES